MMCRSRCRHARGVLRRLIAVTAVAAISAPAGARADLPAEVEARLAHTLESVAAGMGVFGATHAVRLTDGSDEVLATGSAGPNFASQTGRVLAPTDQVRIGSQTKTYVATVVLHQVDQGLVGLDDRVFDLVSDPGWTLQDWHREITIEHLLSMRSGLADYLSVPDNEQSDRSTIELWNSRNGLLARSPQTLVASTLPFAPTGTPGDPDAFFYSNTNFVLLGLVAETVSCSAPGGCRGIDELVADVVTGPLALSGTLLPTGLDPSQPFSDGTWLDRGVLWSGTVASFSRIDPSVPGSAGAMLSVPADQLRWVVDLTTNDTGLLSDATFQERLRLTTIDAGEVSGTPAGYGLGIYRVVSPNTGATLLGHGGTISGYQTVMFQHGGDGHFSVLNFNTFVANRADPGTRPSDPMAGAFALERALLLPDPADRIPGACETAGSETRCRGTFETQVAASGTTVIEPSGNAWPGSREGASPVPSVLAYRDQAVGIALESGSLTIAQGAAVEVVGDDAIAIAIDAGAVTVSGSVTAIGHGARALAPAGGRGTPGAGTMTVAAGGSVFGIVDVPTDGVLSVSGTVNGPVAVGAGGRVDIREGGVVYGPIRLVGDGVRITVAGTLVYGVEDNGFEHEIARPPTPAALTTAPALLMAPPQPEAVAPAPLSSPTANPWLPPGLITPTGASPF